MSEKQDPEHRQQSINMNPAPVTGAGDRKMFNFGTPGNFTIMVDGHHLGVIEEKPIHDVTWNSEGSERSWLLWQIGFQRNYLERLERYTELRLAELAASASLSETLSAAADKQQQEKSWGRPMSTPELPDVDPAGIMSLTEYDIATGGNKCATCGHHWMAHADYDDTLERFVTHSCDHCSGCGCKAFKPVQGEQP